MPKRVIIKKHSGEKEAFAPAKLRQSLEKAGAKAKLIARVEKEMQPFIVDGVSTGEIYRRAFRLLRKHQRAAAGRYSLKNAIMDLGPSGYPFEHFVGAVLQALGYEVSVGQNVQGHCISHEVDVVAKNDRELFMVECKFYNSQGKYCNVRVPLYIRSRFKDIEFVWKTKEEYRGMAFRGWVVTNTRFTSDAMDYGRCAGLHLVSWDYPRDHSLKAMIEQAGLFPLTVLTLLSRKHKEKLLGEDVVLVRQLLQKPGLLEELGLTRQRIVRILEEAAELVGEDVA